MTGRSTVLGFLAAATLFAATAWFVQRGADEEPAAPASVAPAQPRARRHARDDSRGPGDALAGIVVGTVVRGPSRVPEPGCRIELLLDGEVKRETVSDGFGRFRVDTLAPEIPYTIRVSAEQSATVLLPSISVHARERLDLGQIRVGPGWMVHVSVRDEEGRPVPGSVVEFYREPEWDLTAHDVFEGLTPFSPIASARLEPDGNVSVPLPPGAFLTVVAHAPGHARVAEAQIAQLLSPDDEIRLVLPRAERLVGLVVDRAGGAVPGALVLARRRPRIAESRHGTPADGAVLWQHVRADADGRFTLEDLPPGRIDLLCSRGVGPPGGLYSVQIPALSDVRLILPATASISGRATGEETGSPIAGVVVVFHCGNVVGRTVTDADGLWTVQDVPTGDDVRAWARPPPGWIREPSAGNAFERDLLQGEQRRIDWVFLRTGTLSGRVVEDGRPAPGAWVYSTTLAEPRSDDDGRVYLQRHETRADADGRYHLTGVLPGRVVAYALPGRVAYDDAWSARNDAWGARFGSRAARDAAAITVGPGEEAELDLEATLPDDYESRSDWIARMDSDVERYSGLTEIVVRGRVSTEDGLPLRAVRVVVHESGDNELLDLTEIWFERWRLVRVEPDGSFETTYSLSGDAVLLHVIATDLRHDAAVGSIGVDANARPDGVTVDVVLPPLPEVRGRVESGGVPVSGASVFFGAAEVARTADDGGFSFSAPTGSWGMGVVAPGFVRRADIDFRVPQGEPLVIEVRSALDLTGIIVDVSGEPVSGVAVIPVDRDGESVGGYASFWQFEEQRAPMTGPDGRFRLVELPLAPISLELSAPGPAASPIAMVSAGPFLPGSGDVRIVVRPPRSLSGRVTSPDGAVVTRASTPAPRSETSCWLPPPPSPAASPGMAARASLALPFVCVHSATFREARPSGTPTSTWATTDSSASSCAAESATRSNSTGGGRTWNSAAARTSPPAKGVWRWSRGAASTQRPRRSCAPARSRA